MKTLKKEVKHLTSQSIAYSLGDFVNYFINFLLFPVYIKMLTPEEYGILMIVTLFGTLMRMIARMGLNDGYMRLYYDYDDEGSRKRLLGATYYGLFIVNIVFFAVFYFFIDFIARLFLDNPLIPASGIEDFFRLYSPLFVVTLIDCVVRSFLNVPFTLLRIQERAKMFAFISILRFAANMILKVLFVVFLRWNVHGIVLVDLITAVFFTIVFIPLVRKHVSFKLDLQMLRGLVSFGFPKVPHNMAHHLLNKSDGYLLKEFVGFASTGLYGVGYTVGMALKFVTYAFNMAWTPHSYKIHKEEDAPKRIARLSTYNMALMLFMALLISLFARELFEVLDAILIINKKWFLALPVVSWIAFAYVFQAAYFLTNIGLSIAKKTKYYPVVTGISLIISVSLNYFIMIPLLEIKGAAITAVISYAAMALLALYFGQKFYRVNWEWRRLITIFSVSALLVLISGIFEPLSLLFRMLLKMLVFFSFPFILFLFGFYTPDEKAFIRSHLHRPVILFKRKNK